MQIPEKLGGEKKSINAQTQGTSQQNRSRDKLQGGMFYRAEYGVYVVD